MVRKRKVGRPKKRKPKKDPAGFRGGRRKGALASLRTNDLSLDHSRPRARSKVDKVALQDPRIKTPFDGYAMRSGLISKPTLFDQRDAIQLAYQHASQFSFLTFVRGLVIDGQEGKRIFESCMADFQRICFEDLTKNIEDVRDGRMPDIRRFWIERTKKASKDADLAIVVAWLIAYPTRPFYGQIGAADREQAGIVRDRLSALLFHNPWLNDKIELVGNEIRSKILRLSGLPLAKFDIKSSDVAGSHGGTPDVMIINELSHITRWEFVENMMDNADGVARGVVIIATNAGMTGTKAFKWRCDALADPIWSVHVLAAPAPWHSKATLMHAKKRNPASRYSRLWEGIWVSGKGDAVKEDKMVAMFVHQGPQRPTTGWQYIAGLDLGVSHDHCALAIVGVNTETMKIRLAYWEAWQPPEEGEINLEEVMKSTKQKCQEYRTSVMLYDPHQAKLMAQMLSKSITCKEWAFTAKNLNLMASAFVQCVENQILECYDDPELRLRGDFGKFNLVEKAFGFKLEALSDETGHADVGTAVVITLPAALQLLGLSVFQEDDPLTEEDPTPLTETEVSEMPDSLRDIYELDAPKRKIPR